MTSPSNSNPPESQLLVGWLTALKRQCEIEREECTWIWDMDRWEIDSINVIISAVPRGEGGWVQNEKQNRKTTNFRRAGKWCGLEGRRPLKYANVDCLHLFLLLLHIGAPSDVGADGVGKVQARGAKIIVILDRWVLDSSRVRCQQLHFICSINLSPVDLSGQVYTGIHTFIKIYTDAANEFMSWSPIER